MKGGVSSLKTNAQATNVVCNICRQSFMCTASAVLLQQHVDSKHSKLTLKDCFPNHA
jgi:transcription elongation factor Elf1